MSPRHPAPLRPAFALRPVSLAVCLLAATPLSFGAPTGAQLVSGQATVKVTAPGQMDITQTTARAALDWTSFSIAAGERVNIAQPGSSSVLLNRVVGNDPSLIYGSLTSNGQVWLINPRGIVFGANSRVDVGGLVASTLSIANSDVASGRIQLGRGSSGAGELRAEGPITASDGSVILVAPQLLQSGRITARRIGLAAATEVLVDVEGDGLVFFNARNDGGLDSKLSVLGRLQADGGSVELRAAARAGFADTVLNLDGIVQARSLGVREGRVVVDGGSSGITSVAGRIDVSGNGVGAKGGDALVLGQKILLDGTAQIDARGDAGGGRVRIGGDYQGSNPDVRNAEMVSVRTGAQIDASAVRQGDGGQVVVWSDQSTRFRGQINSRGGADGGNGGDAEVSGLHYLEFRGNVDLGAAHGRTGSLLLDPETITIQAQDGVAVTGDVDFGDQPANSILLNDGAGGISHLLRTVDLVLQAKQTITVVDPIPDAGATKSLKLQAGGNIFINAEINAVGIWLSANDAGGTVSTTGHVVSTAPINAMGGELKISNNNSGAAHSIGGDLGGSSIVIEGNVALTTSSVWTVSGAADSTYGGVISASGNGVAFEKAGSGRLVLTNTSTYGGTTIVSGGTLRLSGAAAQAGTGTLDVRANTLEIADGARVGNAIDIATGGSILGIDSGSGSGGALTGSAAFVLPAAAAITLSGSGGLLSIERAITGGDTTASVTIGGSGVAFSAGSNYAGSTTVNGGARLLLNGNGAAVGGALTLNAGATLELAGATVNNTLSADNGSTITSSGSSNGTLAAAGGALTLNGAGATLNLSSSGGGALVVAREIGSATGQTVAVSGGTVQSNEALGSGDVTIASNALLRVQHSGSATLGNLITGSGALQLAGGGTTTLSNAGNSYGGGTTVSSSTLRLAGSAGSGSIALDNATLALDLAVGASLDNALSISGTSALSTSGSVHVSAAGSATLAAGATLTLSGPGLAMDRAITDAGDGTVAIGGGDVTLGATNSHRNTRIDSGATLIVASASALGNSAGALTDNGVLRFDSGNALTVARKISGSGSVEKTGAGTLTLQGANDYSGGTHLIGGRIELDGSGRIGGGDVQLDGTTVLRLVGGSFGNAILGAGALEVGGGVTTTLSNTSSSFSGGITVDSGTLKLSGSSAGSGTLTLGNQTLDLSDGAVIANRLNFGSGATITNSSGSGQLAAAADNSTLTLGATATLNLKSEGGSGLRLERVVDGGSANATLAVGTSGVAGTVTLAAANTYTATTTVAATSELRVSGSGQLGSGNVAIGGTLNFAQGGSLLVANTLSGNGQLQHSGAGGTTRLSANNSGFTGGVTISAGTMQVGDDGSSGTLGNGAVTNNATLRISRSDDFELANAVGGSGNLVKTGTTTTTLSGLNTYSGTTTISAGVLEVVNGGSLGSGAVVNNGQLLLNTSGDLTLGAISGSGSLRQAGSGTTTLAGGGSYGGGTTVSAGTLAIGADDAAGAGAIRVASGARLDVRDGSRIANALNLDGGTLANGRGSGRITGAVTLGASSTLASSAGGLTVSGDIGDGGSGFSVTKSGSGEVTLSGSNTYSGGTLVSAGTLTAAGGSAIADATTVDVGSAAVFKLAAAETFSRLTGSGSVDLGALTLTLGTGNTGSVFSGAIGGSGGSLTKVGSGTLELRGANTYTGTTTVSGGTLALSGVNRLATTSHVSVGSGAFLTLDGNQTLLSIAISGEVSGANGNVLSAGLYALDGGRVNVALGGGALTSRGSSELNATAGVGSIDVTHDTLTLASGSRFTNAPSVRVGSGAVLHLGGSETASTLTLDHGLLEGSGTFTATSYDIDTGSITATLGSGALTSRGSSTLDAATGLDRLTAASGVLTLTNNATLPTSVDVTIGDQATLKLGAADTLVGSLTSAGTLEGSGQILRTGTVTLQTNADIRANLVHTTLNVTGDAVLAGTSTATLVTVNGGTLTLAGADRLGSGTTVDVRTASGLALQGDQHIGELRLAGALTGSAQTLEASDYLLHGGATVAARLGGGHLQIDGNATLGASIGATQIDIGASDHSAVLVQMTGADLLNHAATVTVTEGATFRVGGRHTVDTLALSGTLDGSGRLDATTTTLSGGSYGLDFFGSSLVSTGISHFNSVSSSTTVRVLDGELRLSQGGRFRAAPAVTVEDGAQLILGGNETFGSLQGAGRVELGTATLSTGGAAATTFSGVLAGSGGLLKQGSGNFTLTGDNTYTGTTTVNAGMLTVSGTLASRTLQVNAGTLAVTATDLLHDSAALGVETGARVTLAFDDRIDALVLKGTLEGAGTLTAATYELNGGRVDAHLGTGALTSRGASLLNGTAAVTSVNVVSSGAPQDVLTLGEANRLGTGAVTTVAAGTTLALLGNQTLGSLAGAGNVTLGSATLTTGAAGSSSFSGVISGSGGQLVKRGNGNFTLGGSNTYTGATSIEGGTLTLAAANVLADATAVTVATNATLSLNATDTVASLVLHGALTGTGTLSADTYLLDGGNASAHLGAGALTGQNGATLSGTSAATLVTASEGLFTINGNNRLADGAQVVVERLGQLALNGTDTITKLTVRGTLSGSGVFTAPDYVLDGGTISAGLGGGTLVSTGTSTLSGSAAVGTLRVDDGELRLSGSNALTGAPVTTLAAGSTLTLTAPQTLGRLSGSGEVVLDGATLTTGSAGDSSYAGVISGSGGLTKVGDSNFTLSGLNTYGGATRVERGTLTTTRADVLPNGSAVTVLAPATLALGGDDTVASLELRGELTGSGHTLTADDYLLDGGTARANLGAGTFTSRSGSTLYGTSAALSVTVADGTLTLQAGDRLDDMATLVVASGAKLILNGDDTVRILKVSGAIAGTGVLSADSYELTGGTYDFNFGSGTLINSGISILNGTSRATTLLVLDGSSLTLGTANRLLAAPAVTVEQHATLALGGTESIGNLGGAGTVAIGAHTLNTGTRGDSSFAGALTGSGALVKQGSSNFTLAGDSAFSGSTRIDGGTLTLTGTLASSALVVHDGVLVLGSAERLADTAQVGVDADGRLTLAGNERIARLDLAGRLTGSGTLTAASYHLVGGRSEASLGTGVLSASAGSVITGTSAADQVNFGDGVVTLAAADRFTAQPVVTTSNAAEVHFGGAQSFGSLSGGGSVVLDGFTLRTGAAGSSSFAGVLSGSGGLVKEGGGNFTLAGANTYTGATRVEGGTLTIDGSVASLDLHVQAGTLALGDSNRLRDGATVAVDRGARFVLAGDETVATLQLSGTLAGSGTLTAATYALDGASVEADLGHGALTSRGASTLQGRSSADTVNVSADTLTLVGAGRWQASPTVTLGDRATLVLGGNETLGTLTGSGTLNLGAYLLSTGSGGDSSFAGGLVGSGGLVKQGSGVFTLAGDSSYSGTTRIEAGTLVVAGTLTSGRVQIDAGTLALAAANRLNDAALVQVARDAALTLAGNDTVGRLELQGRIDGNATLTAASYALDGGTVDANLGAGALSSRGASTLNGTAAAGTLSVDGGTLLLGSAQRLTAAPAVTVADGATLRLAGHQTLGTLAGLGNVDLAAFTLATGSGGDSRFGGVLSGNGGLVKQGDSIFTLGGSHSYTGTTQVDAGTLALAPAGRLAAASTLAVGHDGTVTLDGDQTVAALNLAGKLSGTGTLHAASYALDGATVEADLGAGTLSSKGASTLSGHAAATTVMVDTGSLTLAAADRFTAAPAVTVADGARLVLAGAQTLGSLAGAGNVDLQNSTLATGSGGESSFAGTIGGSGGLVKQGSSSFTLAGNNSYDGDTRVEGGTLRLSGTLASTTLHVRAGTLALTAADRLADGAAVQVASGAAMTLAGNETIGNLQLQGTLGGSGTLTATNVTLLDRGTVDADVAAGSFTANGASRINGNVAATTLAVETGTLTLGAANRIGDQTQVSVAHDAALQLNGDDRVGTLALQGRLAGSGTLSATRYALQGGQVEANLGAGDLTSRGASTLTGSAAVDTVTVQDGTLTLASAQRLTALPAVQISDAAMLAIQGDQAFGNLGGAGAMALGSHVLRTGTLGDSTFSGVISGSGSLVKQGASIFTLTGASSYTGSTTVAAGTLRLGDGGTAGSLASGSYAVDGTLAFAHSDDVTLAQAVSGSGGIEQAGSGRLVFSGGNKSYTGATRVSQGTLTTAGGGNLSSASAVSVAGGARLVLTGSETLGALDADGSVALGGNLGASNGDLLMRGAVTVADNLAITLHGRKIDAVSDGNRWGASVALDASDRITLSSGRENGALRALTLADVNAGNGGRIDAGLMTLAAATRVSGGTLQLTSSVEQTVLAPDESLTGKQVTGLPLAYAADAVLQTAASRITVDSGSGLLVTVANGGSVQLAQAGNSFMGNVSVVSGSPTAPWSPNARPGPAGGNYAVQSRVRIEGGTVNVGGDGVIADIVSIRADRLATVGPTATIVARMPFDASAGTATSLPALTLELTPQAFTLNQPFGSPGDGGIRVNVGSKAWGGRTLALDAGYVTVLPRGGAQGSTAVMLSGPAVTGSGYRFFFDGAGLQSEIPVFYNGILPTTPAVQNSISATVSVSEGARKERFEEAVRTENVAVRLRAGVIAEVGPAPSATLGTEGARAPRSCAPQQGLACVPEKATAP